jgi:hypothetical protein
VRAADLVDPESTILATATVRRSEKNGLPRVESSASRNAAVANPNR